MKLILFFCLLTLLRHKCDAQNLECIYQSNQYDHLIYSCYLKTGNASFIGTFPRISGQHKTGNNDASVNELKLYENDKMTSLTSVFCKKFKNLKSAQLENAGLESVDEDSLLSCKNLNSLTLSTNKLQELPEFLLVRNPELDSFFCSGNRLTTLPGNFFLNQGKLRTLDLSSNQITLLPSQIFQHLVNLNSLRLSFNKLQTVDPAWFTSLLKLNYLLLQKNEIREVPPNSFKSLRYVTEAYLHENKIQKLHEDSFVGLENVVEFQLHMNEIPELPPNLFSPMRSLQYLYLFNNKLEIVHSDSFAGLDYLSNIRFDSNKIYAMDPKLFDDTPLTSIHMNNNTCADSFITIRDGFKNVLKKCIENYTARDSCGKFVTEKGVINEETLISRGDFPWFAVLGTTKGQFFCTGTLISSRKVVSAAHCIKDKNITTKLFAQDVNVQTDVVVLLGAYDLNNYFEPSRSVYPVQTLNIHPDWNQHSESYDADIVVLVLESEVAFTPNIQPICMVNRISNTAAAMKGFVAGYGKSEDVSKDHENTPRVLEMPIHKNDACFLKNNVLATLSSERTFCAGSGNGRGVCSGDSGSGLIVSDGYTYYLRGIVSSALLNGKQNCEVNTYSLFTDITSYIDWVNNIPTSMNII